MLSAKSVLVASSIDTTAVVSALRRSQLWRPCAKFLKSESRTLDSPDSEHFDSRSMAAGHPQPLERAMMVSAAANPGEVAIGLEDILRCTR